jgi:hypothetical protein
MEFFKKPTQSFVQAGSQTATAGTIHSNRVQTSELLTFHQKRRITAPDHKDDISPQRPNIATATIFISMAHHRRNGFKQALRQTFPLRWNDIFRKH